MNVQYPLTSTTWDEAEHRAIQRVVDSGMFTMGKEVEAFERAFARYIGAKHAVMVNSGSSANLLAIAALSLRKESPLKPGDEVIVPSVSWSTTYYPVHQYGMRLVFSDIDLETLNLDPRPLKAALRKRTRAMFVPHLLGNPAQLDELTEFCQDHDLVLIEDVCESLGATYKGRKLGRFGALGTFSSFFSHHISTMEGGMVVTDDEELHHILLPIRSHGWTRHLPTRNRVCRKSSDPFRESFRFVLPGYNVRPSELQGAIGVEQLRKLPRMIETRRRNASLFKAQFGDDNRYILQRENGTSSWFGFSLVLRGRTPSRERVLSKLRAAGIEHRPIVSGNFLRNDVLRLLNHRIHGRHRNADTVDKRGFFVGNHSHGAKEYIASLGKALGSRR